MTAFECSAVSKFKMVSKTIDLNFLSKYLHIHFSYWCLVDGVDLDSYKVSRMKLLNTIEKKDANEIQNSLKEFELLLVTDEMKARERVLVQKAQDEIEYNKNLRIFCKISTMFAWSILVYGNLNCRNPMVFEGNHYSLIIISSLISEKRILVHR